VTENQGRKSVAEQLLNLTMHDGSRHFGDLPQTALWQEVRDHVGNLPGARLMGFVTDSITEGWIDFVYEGHEFSINDQFGEYYFFVKDPACADETLLEVLAHFGQLLRLEYG
jgi:hypothetical protein